MSKKHVWANYLFEILSVFIGVSIAFALSKWNENRRDSQSELKILIEIRNGLQLDLKDFNENVQGHQLGIKSCKYFRKLLNNEPVKDSLLGLKYFYLVRDFVSIQNKSGYEALKSKGLEFISNDSLRVKVISLYDYHYEIIEKLEGEYDEMQFSKNYSRDINQAFAEYMVFDKKGNLKAIRQPVKLSLKVKNLVLTHLWHIEANRQILLMYYNNVIKKVQELIQLMDSEIKKG